MKLWQKLKSPYTRHIRTRVQMFVCPAKLISHPVTQDEINTHRATVDFPHTAKNMQSDKILLAYLA